MRELTPEGEKPLKDFSRDNYFSMLNELALELGEDSIPRLAPDERPDPLRMAMSGKKILIVFDNLETLPEEERVRLFQFLSRLPAGNKAIVTSRRRADVDARIIRLDRLLHNEAMQLVDELAERYPRLRRAAQQERDELYEIRMAIRSEAGLGQLGRGSQCRTPLKLRLYRESPRRPARIHLWRPAGPSAQARLKSAVGRILPAAKLIGLSTELPERRRNRPRRPPDRSILISNIDRAPSTPAARRAIYQDLPP
jgi:hypothetical protein